MAGRPSFEITEEILDRAEEGAKLGLNYREIAEYIGVTYDTLRRKKKEFNVLKLAIERGRYSGKEEVVRKLIDKVEEGSLQAIMYYLDKVRWADFSEEDDERLEAKAAKLLKAQKKDKPTLTIIHKMEETKSEETTD